MILGILIIDTTGVRNPSLEKETRELNPKLPDRTIPVILKKCTLMVSNPSLEKDIWGVNPVYPTELYP